MAGRKPAVVSAQVLLLPASGRPVSDPSALTAERLSEIAPSPEAARRAARAYAQAGFEVGPLVGNSFSITAPAATFEKALGSKVRKSARGGLEFGAAGLELPPDRLPEALARDVAAVTFTSPPDFGPTSY